MATEAATTLSDTVKAIFRRYDLDESGTIEMRELIAIFRACGMSEESATQMFSVIDIDGDKSVDYEEFLDWLLFPGRTSYVMDDNFIHTDSKEAAIKVRAIGETEASKEKDKVFIMCCECDWKRAEVKCTHCDKYYSWDGYKQTHLRDGTPIEFRDHVVERIWEKPDYGKTSESKKYRRMVEAGLNIELNKKLRKELEWELRKQFEVYDLDAGGSISLEEMTNVAIAMSKFVGENKPEHEIRLQVEEMFETLDEDCSGSIELMEFVKKIADEAFDPGSGSYGPESIKQKAEELTATMKFALKRAGAKAATPKSAAAKPKAKQEAEKKKKKKDKKKERAAEVQSDLEARLKAMRAGRDSS